MYAAGNIILTDQHYEILALLRTHKFEENVLTAVRELYPIEHATTLLGEDGEAADVTGGISAKTSTPQELLDWINGRVLESEAANAPAAAASSADGATANTKSKTKKNAKLTLKQALAGRGSGLSQFGADVIQHCVLHAGLSPSAKLSSKTPMSLEEAGRLLSSMSEGMYV
jgi:hypothetical protein